MTVGSSLTAVNDIPQCGFLIQQGSEESETIKAVIDSKLCEQAEDEDVQVLSPNKTFTPTEPIALANPSPTTIKSTRSKKMKTILRLIGQRSTRD